MLVLHARPWAYAVGYITYFHGVIVSLRIGAHAREERRSPEDRSPELRQEQPRVRWFSVVVAVCDGTRPLLPITTGLTLPHVVKLEAWRPALTIYLANQGLVSSLGENSGPQHYTVALVVRVRPVRDEADQVDAVPAFQDHVNRCS